MKITKNFYSKTLRKLRNAGKSTRLSQKTLSTTKQLYAKPNSLLDYLADGVLVVDDYPRILDAELDIQKNEASWIVDQLKNNVLLDNDPLGLEIRQLIRQKKQSQIFLSIVSKGDGPA